MDKLKVSLISLGCPKNLVDSEVMLGQFPLDRYEIVTDESAADIIIVNTCSFINDAKEESVDTILEAADYKEDGNCKILVVAGCLPQRYKGNCRSRCRRLIFSRHLRRGTHRRVDRRISVDRLSDAGDRSS